MLCLDTPATAQGTTTTARLASPAARPPAPAAAIALTRALRIAIAGVPSAGEPPAGEHPHLPLQRRGPPPLPAPRPPAHGRLRDAGGGRRTSESQPSGSGGQGRVGLRPVKGRRVTGRPRPGRPLLCGACAAAHEAVKSGGQKPRSAPAAGQMRRPVRCGSRSDAAAGQMRRPVRGAAAPPVARRASSAAAAPDARRAAG